jgi:hypothetical protein
MPAPCFPIVAALASAYHCLSPGARASQLSLQFSLPRSELSGRNRPRFRRWVIIELCGSQDPGRFSFLNLSAVFLVNTAKWRTEPLIHIGGQPAQITYAGEATFERRIPLLR